MSKSYPTEADVWKLAAESGLISDVESARGKPAPRRVLDNDYEIRACQAEAGECPEKNERDAQEQKDFQLLLKGRAV
ncbi:MAG: hypothetical protein NT113_24855 [Hyphomicrobiales bacterium]|nr:hypothetical protein [Hyphomicrobiales bacterium]